MMLLEGGDLLVKDIEGGGGIGVGFKVRGLGRVGAFRFRAKSGF